MADGVCERIDKPCPVCGMCTACGECMCKPSLTPNGPPAEHALEQRINEKSAAIKALGACEWKYRCQWCVEGYKPIPSSVTDMMVHPNTPVGRVVCGLSSVEPEGATQPVCTCLKEGSFRCKFPHPCRRCNVYHSGVSCYWAAQGKTPADKIAGGRTFERQDGSLGCDECCNDDRCDDRTHRDRENCPYCLGSGDVPAQGATKDFRQTVAERIERDPEFREALVVERAEAEPQAGAQQECPGCQFVNRNHLYSCPARHRVKPQAGAQVDFTLEEAFHAGFQACKELAEGVVDEHDGYLNRVSDLDASSAWMGWSGEGVDYGKH